MGWTESVDKIIVIKICMTENQSIHDDTYMTVNEKRILHVPFDILLGCQGLQSEL